MSGTRSDRRKALESAGKWSAVLYLDGVPVTGPVPCEDYEAALIASPLVASWLGGPVSVAQAVTAVRIAEAAEPTLFTGVTD